MYNEIDLDKIDISKEPPTDEPARQYYFMAKCREWVREFEKKNGRRPFFFTQTFGWNMPNAGYANIYINIKTIYFLSSKNIFWNNTGKIKYSTKISAVNAALRTNDDDIYALKSFSARKSKRALLIVA